jgi:hypothetical protein
MPRTHYPSYDPALRIAVLTPDLDIPRIRRQMSRSRAVAATAVLLRQLAEAVEAGAATLPPVDAAVIVLTGICHGELSALERDLFWRVFQVPVFEQFVSAEGRILAMECDAHQGLHLLDSDAPLPGYRAFLETEPCGCGNPHPRLSRLDRLTPDSAAASRVGAAVPAQVYEYGDEENQQVGPARRVA